MSRTQSGRDLGTQVTPDIPERTASPDLVDPNLVEPNLGNNRLPLPNVNVPIDPAMFQQQMMAMMNLLTQSVANQN